MEQKTGWRSRNSQTWFKPVLILTLIVWISACQQIEPGPNPSDTAIIPAATQSAYPPPVLTIPPYIPPSFQTLTPTPQPTRTLRLSLTPPVTPIPTTPILETFPSAAALKSGGVLIETGDLTHTLWYANPDGSGEQALGVGFDRYSLSPNQKEALLIRSGGLWLSVLGSNTAKEILPASPQYGDVVTATFSPDEHWIALAYQKHYQADSPEPTHIVVIDSQTKAVKFEHDQKFSGFSLGWTPDSQGLMVQQIGLSVLPIFSAGKPEMKEISGDCGSLVLVTPEWTPDGKLIIYTVYGNGRGAMGKVCVINPETANVSQVQAGGSVEGSAVDPGSRFLYLAVMNPDYDNQGIDPDWRLLRYDLQNHSLELLTPLIYGGQNLSLSPDGKRMMFSERDGQILTIIEVGTWKKTPIALDGRLTSVCGWLDNDHLLLSQAKRDNIQSRILFSFDIANGQMLQISGYHEMQACRVQILNNWP